jgi:hypothetical protein
MVIPNKNHVTKADDDDGDDDFVIIYDDHDDILNEPCNATTTNRNTRTVHQHV